MLYPNRFVRRTLPSLFSQRPSAIPIHFQSHHGAERVRFVSCPSVYFHSHKIKSSQSFPPIHLRGNKYNKVRGSGKRFAKSTWLPAHSTFAVIRFAVSGNKVRGNINHLSLHNQNIQRRQHNLQISFSNFKRLHRIALLVPLISDGSIEPIVDTVLLHKNPFRCEIPIDPVCQSSVVVSQSVP